MSNARTGENFIHKFDNVGFAPSVLFREFFRLVLPRSVQDVVNARVAAVKDLFDPVISVRLILGHTRPLAVRHICLVFRKVGLKDTRELAPQSLPRTDCN